MATDSSRYLSDLHKQIDRLFNLEEVRTLCFDLGVDFDNVAGESKSARIRELILQLARRDELQSLIDLVRKERPHAVWLDLPADFALPESLAAPEKTPPVNANYYGPVMFNQQGQNVHGPQINAGGDLNVDHIGDVNDGDTFTVGDITGSSGVAIGEGATTSMRPPAPIPEMSGGPESLPESLPEARTAAEPVNQTRRFEAAMPETVHVDETTELLVMLPRLNSPGLSAFLPLETIGGETIKREDVEGQEAEFQFPGRNIPIVVYISVKVASRDFEVEDGDRSVKIYLDRDGDYETFYITPLRSVGRAPVTIRLYADKEREHPVSTIRLDTRIEAGAAAGSNAVLVDRLKEVVSYVGGASAITFNIIGGDQISATITNSTGAVVGRESAATVATTTVTGGGSGGGTLFEQLQTLVAREKPELAGTVAELQAQVARGTSADDETVAGLIDGLKGAGGANVLLKAIMTGPEAAAAADGPATKFVLGRL